MPNYNAAGNPKIGEPKVESRTSNASDEDDFSRFRTLAQKLVKVPKPELDKKRREKD